MTLKTLNKTALISLFIYSLWHMYLIEYFGFPPFLDDVAIFLFLSFFVAVSVIKAYAPINMPRASGVAFVYIYLSVLYVLVSYASNGFNYPLLSFVAGARDHILPLMFFYVVSRINLGPKLICVNERYIQYFIVVVVIIIIFGFVFKSSNLAITHTSDSGPPSLRVGIGYVNPNTYAYMLVFTIVYSMSRYIYFRKVEYLWFSLALYVMSILSTSRSAMLLGVLCISFLFIFRFNNAGVNLATYIKKISLMLFIIFAVYAAVILLIEYLPNLRVTRFSGLSRIFLASARLEIWLGIINDYYVDRSFIEWVFGNGVGGVTRSAGVYEWRVFDSHWLKTLTESGLFGMFMQVFFIAYVFRIAIKCIKSSDVGLKVIGLTVLWQTSIISSLGFVSSIFDIFPVNYFYYFFVGIMFNAYRVNRNKSQGSLLLSSKLVRAGV